MLHDVVSSGNEKEDFRDLGRLMIRLMELGHSLVNPRALELEDPGKWNDQIKSFLHKLANYGGETLRQA